MEKQTVIAASGSVVDAKETRIPHGYSSTYVVGRTLSRIAISGKCMIVAGVIFIMELARMPKAVTQGGLTEYLKGFGKRYLQATGFVIGGERLMAAMMYNSRHPREVQLQLLRKILKNNAATKYGKTHGFDKIDSVDKYRNQVPVNGYNDLEPYIEEHLKGSADVLVAGKPCYYATTSGSTGRPKFIPVTRAMEKEAHEGSARLWSYTLYKNESRAYSGNIIVIVSPAVEGYTEANVPYGSISGQYIKNLNENIRSKYTIPFELYEVKDYEARYYCMLLLGMADPETSMLSSTNPSTLSLLAEKGNHLRIALLEDIRLGRLNASCNVSENIRAMVDAKLTPNPARADYLKKCYESDPENMLRPIHYWQKLVVIACWTGGNSKVFLNRMKKWYGDVQIKDLGYLASEIRGSVPLNINSSEGMLTIDENFFEFVKEGTSPYHNDNFLMVDQLAVGERYRLYFTNRGGLYRYDINDIVEVKGFVNGVPTIDFVQKGKGVTNITGEKIYEQQILGVVEKASRNQQLHVVYFQAQARVEESRYDLFCEFEGQDIEERRLRDFLNDVELLMKEANLEYRTKRDSQRLSPFQLHQLGPNSFERFRKWRVANGVREAQIKNIPLSDDISLIEPLDIQKTIILG